MDKLLYPVGNDIVIPCEVEGYPQPSVHWFHEDVPVESDDRVRIFNQNELRIFNSTTQDAGSYRCDAVNEYGSSSSSVTISVEGKSANLSASGMNNNFKHFLQVSISTRIARIIHSLPIVNLS